jgi:hypothetical protein
LIWFFPLFEGGAAKAEGGFALNKIEQTFFFFTMCNRVIYSLTFLFFGVF